MGYKLGIGLLLFGILLSNGSVWESAGEIFFLVGAFLGFIGLILVAVAHSRERKTYFSNRTPDQYGQNNVSEQNDINEEWKL